MKKVHSIIIAFLFSVSAFYNANAQATGQKITMSKTPTFIMPDGSVLPADKLDSVSRSWGDGNMTFMKKTADDEKGIIYLVRETAQMKEESRRRQEASKLAYDAMLNKPAPDFELKDLQGNSWSLKALRGKVVVLNFWFTTCAPCIQEMPDLNELVKTYENRNVVFLGLTFNDAARVNRFLQNHSFTYTLLPGSGEVDKKYHIASWPISIVIDKEGNIQKLVSSMPNIREELAGAIDALR
ncbi:peroxiredoxin [Filimonas zeae]|uniref:Thioredoxin domain-containing protein n=1 Tax=Filimonas zeae TaxID=1737353 RepID=A0A917J2I4_9BACT|nr:TlpA disulfide reductase family protein [Filimonas zeae]MDR6340476.1 peroxiredoxin [Filimonas zeae]GGH72920.1 hypothetical protein GCM10011379_33870 [Filimonas zeae]